MTSVQVEGGDKSVDHWAGRRTMEAWARIPTDPPNLTDRTTVELGTVVSERDQCIGNLARQE